MEVTPVFAADGDVGHFQLPDVVIRVGVIAAVGARVPDALVAGVVKVFTPVEDGVRAVVEIGAGQARHVVVRVGDVRGIWKREFDWQARSMPHLVCVSERASRGSHAGETMRRVPSVSVCPTARRLLQCQAAPEPRVVVSVGQNVARLRAACLPKPR